MLIINEAANGILDLSSFQGDATAVIQPSREAEEGQVFWMTLNTVDAAADDWLVRAPAPLSADDIYRIDAPLNRAILERIVSGSTIKLSANISGVSHQEPPLILQIVNSGSGGGSGGYDVEKFDGVSVGLIGNYTLSTPLLTFDFGQNYEVRPTILSISGDKMVEFNAYSNFPTKIKFTKKTYSYVSLDITASVAAYVKCTSSSSSSTQKVEIGSTNIEFMMTDMVDLIISPANIHTFSAIRIDNIKMR
jgi:hypothetical protein